MKTTKYIEKKAKISHLCFQSKTNKYKRLYIKFRKGDERRANTEISGI